jgi:hypothetical protein
MYRSTLAVVEGEWSASRFCRFTLGDRAPGTHCLYIAGLDEVEKRNPWPPPPPQLRCLVPLQSFITYRIEKIIEIRCSVFSAQTTLWLPGLNQANWPLEPICNISKCKPIDGNPNWKSYETLLRRFRVKSDDIHWDKGINSHFKGNIIYA